MAQVGHSRLGPAGRLRSAVVGSPVNYAKRRPATTAASAAATREAIGISPVAGPRPAQPEKGVGAGVELTTAVTVGADVIWAGGRPTEARALLRRSGAERAETAASAAARLDMVMVTATDTPLWRRRRRLIACTVTKVQPLSADKPATAAIWRRRRSWADELNCSSVN